MPLAPDLNMVRTGWKCLCPRCGKAGIYAPGFTLSVRDSCPECGLELAKNDSADGPAVFLIFILGFLVIPLALFTQTLVDWPIWLHGLVWGAVTLGGTIGSLRPLKAYIIALQYKHRGWS